MVLKSIVLSDVGGKSCGVLVCEHQTVEISINNRPHRIMEVSKSKPMKNQMFKLKRSSSSSSAQALKSHPTGQSIKRCGGGQLSVLYSLRLPGRVLQCAFMTLHPDPDPASCSTWIRCYWALQCQSPLPTQCRVTDYNNHRSHCLRVLAGASCGLLRTLCHFWSTASPHTCWHVLSLIT